MIDRSISHRILAGHQRFNKKTAITIRGVTRKYSRNRLVGTESGSDGVERRASNETRKRNESESSTARIFRDSKSRCQNAQGGNFVRPVSFLGSRIVRLARDETKV